MDNMIKITEWYAVKDEDYSETENNHFHIIGINPDTNEIERTCRISAINSCMVATDLLNDKYKLLTPATLEMAAFITIDSSYDIESED